MSLTNCRFYEEKYPEVESFVMVNVKQIAEMGAYVKLLEYGRSISLFMVQCPQATARDMATSASMSFTSPFADYVQTTLTA
jgi:hypothetical protein